MANEKTLNLIGIVIKVVIIAPALIAGLLVMGSGVDADSAEEVQQAFMDSVSFSAVTNISFITIIAAVVLVLGFFVLLLVTRPATAIKSVLGIIIAAVIFFILYGIGTSETSETLQLSGGLTASEGEINFTHAGVLTALFSISVATVLALFLGIILKLVRRI